MKQAFALAYGLTSYALFFGLFLYMIGFLGNVFVPISVDVGPEAPFGTALVIDAALILLFGLQHSIMARPSFKRAWTKIVPKSIERSTYVLASTVALAALMFFWRPLPMTLWDFTGTPMETLGWVSFGFGWVFLLVSTFLINHFDLFGLAQVYQFAKGTEAKELKFATRAFYKVVRHPIYVGWFIASWCTPVMTVGHLVYAAGMSIYMLVAIPFEERDLIAVHGETYRAYKQSVPALIPRLVGSATRHRPANAR